MQYEHLDFQVQDGVAQVEFLGPGSPPIAMLCEEFLDLMLKLQEDTTVRVILVTDGDHSFDLSPDLERLAQGKCDGDGFDSLTPDLDVARNIVTIIQEMAKPVVAAARGSVRESGFGFYLATDIRVASTTATFTPPDMSRGLLPDWGLSFTLPRLVGPGRTLEMIWTQRTLSAQEANNIGLVDRVIEEDAFDQELAKLVSRLSDLPQPAVRLTKLAAQQASQFDMTSMLAYEYEAQQQCWSSFETAEGMAAYLAGRRPQYPSLESKDEE
jgi:enoyl-CoA hydratase/carnithine racemase